MRPGWTKIDADVLVVGGGVAGSMAAIAALESGLQVVICEKGKVLDHCGSIGCGVDHYLTVLNSGPEWDTPEYLIKHLPGLTDGLFDMEVTSRVIHEMPRIFRKLESFGIDFRDRKLGTYCRLRSFGLPGNYTINFDGTDFKKHLGERVRKGKATVLMRTMAVQLLTRDNLAYGALAFNFRTGEWYAIRARAVVLAAGDVNRLSRNASGLAFDSWHFPYNTGDAHAMGYQAGAVLANMESVEATLTPKAFSCQGLNAYVSLGAHFVNRTGERFMFKYDKKGENARRAVIIDAVVNEHLAGNGPIYLDCRHLSAEMLDHMEATLKVDRYTLPAFYRQKGINFREELIEVSISELSIRKSGVHFRGSGLAIDANGRTSVEGLFAAGDCTTVSAGISVAAVLGYVAGEGVVNHLRGSAGALPDVDAESVETVHTRASRLLHNSEGLSWRRFEDEIRRIVTDYVGVRRNDKGLRLALDALQALEKQEDALKADGLHDVMRVHEAKHIRLNAELMATASLTRTETRTGSSHRRLDYPDRDDENWRKFVIVSRGTGGPAVRTLPAERPLADVFSRH